MKTLKEIYNMSYDTSGFNSGLVNWYNKLIDKTYEELDTEDVLRMLRQDILEDLAKKRMIELFLKDPYDGYIYDGELLNTIIEDTVEFNHQRIIRKILDRIDYNNYDWEDEEQKILFIENIKKLKEIHDN